MVKWEFLSLGLWGVAAALFPPLWGNETALYGDLSPSFSLNIKICSSPACSIKKINKNLEVKKNKLTKDLFSVFGEASGLQTNLSKSCVIPIQCEGEIINIVNKTLQCTTTSFPCTYMGLPISNNKLRRCDLMAWIEKVADRLPGWKASHEHVRACGAGAFCTHCHPLIFTGRHQSP